MEILASPYECVDIEFACNYGCNNQCCNTPKAVDKINHGRHITEILVSPYECVDTEFACNYGCNNQCCNKPI